MAIRRPGINAPTWLYQDFLYSQESDRQLRYLQVKWDGKFFDRVSESFDYSNPPYPNSEQRGGPIVAQINYTVQGTVITVNDWDLNWRDEWPLRLGVNYLTQCLYPTEKNFVIRVASGEVYNQAGDPITVVDHSPYAFWVSEQIFPATNAPDDYLYR